jgi:hypothetical protein
MDGEIEKLVAGLRAYWQIDDNGSSCGVSRQAVEESATMLERMASENKALRYERDVARAKFDRTVKILVGIHNLISPPIQEVNGKRYQFRSPIIEEQMQALSDRIRAIPDEIAVVDAVAAK